MFPEAERILYPFDGECPGSTEADITITFSKEKAPLRANSRHLIEASPILNLALTKCRLRETLDAGNDSREAWLLLLNLAHPGRQTGCPTSDECRDLHKMVRDFLSEKGIFVPKV